MADTPREAWITGIGIVSCLGEGAEAHWQGFAERRIKIDAERFAPYLVHPLAPLDLDKQIPKKGDQRQMEPWQRIGTYAAGLALADAGVKGNADLLARMDMIVAAAGGERDEAVDTAILSGLPNAPSRGAFMNERLMSDLRPTLFLAARRIPAEFRRVGSPSPTPAVAARLSRAAPGRTPHRLSLRQQS